jgi:hypothetical protein
MHAISHHEALRQIHSGCVCMDFAVPDIVRLATGFLLAVCATGPLI